MFEAAAKEKFEQRQTRASVKHGVVRLQTSFSLVVFRRFIRWRSLHLCMLPILSPPVCSVTPSLFDEKRNIESRIFIWRHRDWKGYRTHNSHVTMIGCSSEQEMDVQCVTIDQVWRASQDKSKENVAGEDEITVDLIKHGGDIALESCSPLFTMPNNAKHTRL